MGFQPPAHAARGRWVHGRNAGLSWRWAAISPRRQRRRPPIPLKVTDKDHVLGDPNAKVTVIEYASLTCPHCAGFHTTILPELKKLYIDTGKVKLVFRDFPLDRVALQASLLAECVPADRYFAMVDMLFQTQAQWSRARDPQDALSKAGRLLGIDDVKFRACQDDKEALAAIIGERQGAESIGVQFDADSGHQRQALSRARARCPTIRRSSTIF